MSPAPLAPTADDVAATARTAGLALSPETAARIAVAITPALQTFAPVSADLPFDLEPAGFVVAQQSVGATK